MTGFSDHFIELVFIRPETKQCYDLNEHMGDAYFVLLHF